MWTCRKGPNAPRHRHSLVVYSLPINDPLHARPDRLLDRPFRVVRRFDVYFDHLAGDLSHYRRRRSDAADGAVGEPGKIARLAAGGEYRGKHPETFLGHPD